MIDCNDDRGPGYRKVEIIRCSLFTSSRRLVGRDKTVLTFLLLTHVFAFAFVIIYTNSHVTKEDSFQNRIKERH